MQRSKLFKGASQYSQEHLQEQLVPARMTELYAVMADDRQLYELLNTKAKHLPHEYLMLVDEFTEDTENLTLLDLIRVSLTRQNRPGFTIKNFFSKAGEKLLGFAAYFISEDEVKDIKMFSFDIKRSNPVLIRDLKTLLENLLQQYAKVSWSARKENPANRIYQRTIDEFHGTKAIEGDFVLYTVERSKR